ncbi:SH3 domain-containing protein [Flagellimonas olearia]|uniref:SH3b domain-containing protein n=1 Tax=Flagellimonas olearia TaxID=552546 RepID=A0A444VM03_9FLAO|nr:SH3 domain-containing protein [Allomuricauda olearia]RYC51821.1 hypothetical protein DN53_07995 [Allomuricauda olearia]
MKARFYTTLLVCIFAFSSIFSQHNPEQAGFGEFQPGQQVYVFGNEVQLRTAPDTSSDVLQKLKIGEWVKIIEKTPNSWPYNGFESPFYKVKYNEMTGYILGGLLSIQRKTLKGTHYYFALSKQGNTVFLNIRHVQDGTYWEKKTRLVHTDFKITVLGDKGVPNLDGILFVDYLSNTEDRENGGIYLFPHNHMLTEVVQLSQVSEAGNYYHSENLIFPDDHGGIPDKIFYKKEQGKNLDASSNWIQTAVETRELSWVDGKLIPKYNKKVPNP